MISGTLGPVASAFSICALVRPWRQLHPPGTDIQKAEYRHDPGWLLAINATQLAIALVANMFLLLNMAKRVRFTIAQPVTMVGWYISSICLMALDISAARHLKLHPIGEHIWSQAYFYGIYAAVLYFIVASLNLVTFLGAHNGYYAKDFELTTSQRTLMLQTIMFLMYLLIGALVFCKIEGWNYLDALYWADVTLFTIGFGDYHAVTTLGRALLIPYALVGVISLGLVIGSIRSLMLDRGKSKLGARIVDHKRRRKLRRLARSDRSGILEPVQVQETNGGGSQTSRTGDMTELERRREEFNIMRRIQRQAAHRRRWLALATSTGVWLVLWLVGAKIFEACESPYQHWNYFDGFYLCFVSLMTIGYGDVTPISNCGKSFFVFWSLLALPTMTVLISNAGDTVVKVVRDATNLLGTITILPGERGFKKDLKAVLRMLSCGALWEEDIEDTPPGFLGAAQLSRDGSEDESEVEDTDQGSGQNEANAEKKNQHKVGDEGTEGRTSDTTASRRSREMQRTSRRTTARQSGEIHPPSRRTTAMRPSTKRSLSLMRQGLATIVPTRKAEYHLRLVKEIANLTQKLKESTARKYTYSEWVYYLKLMGEDETSADTHRATVPHGKKPRSSRTHGEEDACNGGQWSWVGDKSPLMACHDETEWILDKLVKKLTEELKKEAAGGVAGEED